MSVINIDKSIICSDGSILKPLEKDYKYYFKNTTLIFGRNKSGKTTILNEIMYLCKDLIPICFVITQTNTSNENFTNIVPEDCIFSNLDDEWLTKIWKRQTDSAATYKLINNVDNLHGLFDLLKTKEDEILKYKCLSKFKKYSQIIQSSDFNFEKKKKMNENITKSKNKYLIKLYKNVIRQRSHLLENTNLTDIQKLILRFLDFNPNIMLIFDDCASKFKKWYKSKRNDIIKQLFYEGRHSHITTIITSQDDKEIDSELRKNALVTIFTTEEAAIANFTRPSNCFSKITIEMAQIYTKEIFKICNIQHAKLMYLREYDDSPFRYTIANIYPPFQIGCKPLWEYCKVIKKSNKKSYKDNIFFNQINKK